MCRIHTSKSADAITHLSLNRVYSFFSSHESHVFSSNSITIHCNIPFDCISIHLIWSNGRFFSCSLPLHEILFCSWLQIITRDMLKYNFCFFFRFLLFWIEKNMRKRILSFTFYFSNCKFWFRFRYIANFIEFRSENNRLDLTSFLISLCTV